MHKSKERIKIYRNERREEKNTGKYEKSGENKLKGNQGTNSEDRNEPKSRLPAHNLTASGHLEETGLLLLVRDCTVRAPSS
jgi:hypothetical protein